MTDRRHERIAVSLVVEYRTAGAFLVAYSVNLSKGGIFLETDRPPPVGTELSLKLKVPKIGPLEVRGVVAWVRAGADDGRLPGMGIQFDNIEERHGDVIDRIVAAFKGLRVVVLAADAQQRAHLVRAVRSILATAEVVEASDADSAESLFRSRDADLVLIELDESDADGLLTLRLAKALVGRPLPVIAAARDEAARARARELGADEVLVAPPPLPDLHAAIVRAMARPLRVE